MGKNNAVLVFLALLLIAGSAGASFTLYTNGTLDFLDGIKITLKSADGGDSFGNLGQTFPTATFSVSKDGTILNCEGIGKSLTLSNEYGPSAVGWCYLNDEKLVGIILTSAGDTGAIFDVVYKDKTFKSKDDMAVYISTAKKTAAVIAQIKSAASPASVTGLKAISKRQGGTVSFSDLALTVTRVSAYSAEFTAIRGKDNKLDCGPPGTMTATLFKGGEAVCVDEKIGNAEILKLKLVDLIEGKAYLQILYPVVGGKWWDVEQDLLQAYPYAPDSSVADVAYLVRQGTSIIQESGGKFGLHEQAPFSVVFDNLPSGKTVFFGSKEALDKLVNVWKEEPTNVEDITQTQRFFSELSQRAPVFNGDLIIPQKAEEIKFGKIESGENATGCKRVESSGWLECEAEITKINGKDVKDSELSEITLVVLIDWEVNGKLDKAKEYKEMKIDFKSSIGKGYVVLEPVNAIAIGNAGYTTLDDYAKKLVVKKGAAIIAQYKSNVQAGQGRIFVIGDKYIIINGLEQNTTYALFHGASEGIIKVEANDPDLIVGECNERQSVKDKTVGGKKVLYCE